jgi:hypothetical protein
VSTRALSTAEADEIRGQMAAAQIAGDHKMHDFCRRALSGHDVKTCFEAKKLCRHIWAHEL